jgi:Ser/Thr protein kinase RdoA (MazF antagonist)
MSSLLSTKAPAHAGLRAREPAFVSADLATADRLRAICGDGDVRRLVSNLAAPTGYYLLERGGAPAVFIKLLHEREIARQIAADRFARHVAGRGLAASTLLPGFPKAFGPSLAVVGYPWIGGRFARGHAADCAAVGRLLARLHLALAAWPEAEAVRRDTERRLEQLDAAASRAAGDLRRLLTGCAGLFDLMRSGRCQVIHGDMNHGNVIFPDGGAEPVALDFEDARISWLPPALDVAYALERFALASEPDDDLAHRAGERLLAGYAVEAAPGPIFPYRGALKDILQMLALRSLVQLSMAAPAKTEEDKFRFLHQHAELRADLLADLEAPHL